MPKSHHIHNITVSIIFIIIAGGCLMPITVNADGSFQLKTLAVRMPKNCKCQKSTSYHSPDWNYKSVSAGNNTDNVLSGGSSQDLAKDVWNEFSNFTTNDTMAGLKLTTSRREDPKITNEHDKTTFKAEKHRRRNFLSHKMDSVNTRNKDIKTSNEFASQNKDTDTTEDESKPNTNTTVSITSCLAHHQLHPSHDMSCTLGQATTSRPIVWTHWTSEELVKLEEPVFLKIPFTYAWPGCFTLHLNVQWDCCDHSIQETMTSIVDSLTPSSRWILLKSQPAHGQSDHPQSHRFRKLSKISTPKPNSVAIRHGKSRRSIRRSIDKANGHTRRAASQRHGQGQLECPQNFRRDRTIVSQKSASMLSTADVLRFKDSIRQRELSTGTNAAVSKGVDFQRISSTPWPFQTLPYAKSYRTSKKPSEPESKPSLHKTKPKRTAGDLHQNFLADIVLQGRLRRSINGPVTSTDTILENSVDQQFVTQVRIVCSENYYGKNCTTFCRARDDYLGHFTCTSTGQQVCREGWRGLECSQAICDPRCLSTRASCPAPNTCVCRQGWSGPHCDQCTPGRGCVHGGCSLPGQCVCQFGWTGPRCDKELNFCELHQPCLNGGTCTHLGQHEYTCACAVGYKGRHCEIEICQEDFCGDKGVCFVKNQTRFCRCLREFTGPRCQLRLKSRQVSNSSLTSSTPSPLKTLLKSMPRLESKGCDGMNCTDKRPHKLSQNTPAAKNSSCTNLSCEDKTIDDHLESTSESSSCETLICHNGGKCKSTKDAGTAFCACPELFTGRQCLLTASGSDTRTRCSNNPCRHGGVCFNTMTSNSETVSETKGFLCQCMEGFSGDTCDEIVALDTSICASKPCQNGGTCVEHDGEFMCACRRGFRGQLCHKRRKNKRVTRLKVEIKTTYYSPSEKPSSSSSSSYSSLSSLSFLACRSFGEINSKFNCWQKLFPLFGHTFIPLFIAATCNPRLLNINNLGFLAESGASYLSIISYFFLYMQWCST